MGFARYATLCATIFATVSACSADATEATTNDDSLDLHELPIYLRSIEEHAFTQEIDHPLAPGPSLGTFSQRYWISKDFVRGPDSPVLLYFCGEAECDGSYGHEIADSAKTLGAAVVVLEHRYYGASLPYPDLTLEHMKYLTIHNALEDAAAFEAYARTTHQLQGKWIAVGGSYAGMLAAFYREKHPELVVGAWASSAPVDLQKTFWGYDAIASRTVGTECALLFRQALDSAGASYDDPGKRQALSDAFHGVIPTDDKATFLSGIADYLLSGAQYGSSKGFCAALEQHSGNPIDGVIGFLNPPLVPDPPPAPGPLDAGPDASPDAAAPAEPPRLGFPRLRRPDPSGSLLGSEWLYQVCTEVGFYQVHNPDRSQSVMSVLVDEHFYDAQCDAVVHQRPDVEKARAEYYAPIAAGQVSNIFFVNGSLDPWSSLSFVDPAAPPTGTTAFVVQQGSHCDDLGQLQRDSLLGVFEAHVKFHQLAQSWLAQ